MSAISEAIHGYIRWLAGKLHALDKTERVELHMFIEGRHYALAFRVNDLRDDGPTSFRNGLTALVRSAMLTRYPEYH